MHNSFLLILCSGARALRSSVGSRGDYEKEKQSIHRECDVFGILTGLGIYWTTIHNYIPLYSTSKTMALDPTGSSLKQYGGIFMVWIRRRPAIVISNPQITIDLMEKRSNIYSGYAKPEAGFELLLHG